MAKKFDFYKEAVQRRANPNKGRSIADEGNRSVQANGSMSPGEKKRQRERHRETGVWARRK